MASFMYWIVLLLCLLDDVASYEFCSLIKTCKDGYYCCVYDTACCKYSLSGGSIAGVVIGIGVVTVACIVVCIICLRRRRAVQGTVVGQSQAGAAVVVATTLQTAVTPGGFIQQPAPSGQPAPVPSGQPASYGQPAPFGQPSPSGQPAPYGQVPSEQTMSEPNKSATPPAYTPY